MYAFQIACIIIGMQLEKRKTRKTTFAPTCIFWSFRGPLLRWWKDTFFMQCIHEALCHSRYANHPRVRFIGPPLDGLYPLNPKLHTQPFFCLHIRLLPFWFLYLDTKVFRYTLWAFHHFLLHSWRCCQLQSLQMESFRIWLTLSPVDRLS